ncbi:MAG: hypothetical protein V4635_04115 [Bacteroidota bacterium]
MADREHLPLQKYADQLITLFQSAITSKDPAVFLYKNEARTPLFMAESLARLMCKINPGHRIEKALKAFKKPEDLLGEADHYDSFNKQFSKNKAVSKAQLDYLVKKRNKAFKKLNEKLPEKDYYQEPFNRLAAEKINFEDIKLISGIEKQIRTELKDSAGFFAKYPEKFTDLESQVHEIRRKLRWISIYSQSLQGIIVLKTQKTKPSWEKEFQSKTSLSSAFNKLPLKKGLAKHIYFNRNAFYALTYTIDRLGVIKDQAQAIEVLAKSIKKTGALVDESYIETAIKQLGVKYTEKDLMQDAHELLEKFFVTYKIHEKLL